MRSTISPLTVFSPAPVSLAGAAAVVVLAAFSSCSWAKASGAKASAVTNEAAVTNLNRPKVEEDEVRIGQNLGPSVAQVNSSIWFRSRYRSEGATQLLVFSISSANSLKK